MKNLKNIIFVFAFIVSIYLLQSCFQKPYCEEPNGTMVGIIFRNITTGQRISSQYIKVYEKSVGIKIDTIKYSPTMSTTTAYNSSLNYYLPLPRTKPVPEELCFIFEKANGQRDSITISGDLKFTQHDNGCRKAIVPYYENLRFISSKTSFVNIQQIPTTNPFQYAILDIKL